jgi:O-methyltransferase involved in polyketide biosynthesis
MKGKRAVLNGKSVSISDMDRHALTAEKETLFIPLCAKALDYRAKKSILKDSQANRIVAQAGIDVRKYGSTLNIITVIRACQLDEWVKAFLSTHDQAVVVYLGCGLDTRITRIPLPALSVWFDIDYPEVIALRQNFFTEHDHYRMIGSSITSAQWLEQIPADKPVLIIADGVLEYLSDQEVHALFKRIINHFAGGQIIFDVMSREAIQSGNKKMKHTIGAVLKWSVDHEEDIDRIDERLKRLDMISVFKTAYMKQLPLKIRIICGILTWFPKSYQMMQLVRCTFTNDKPRRAAGTKAEVL